MNCNEANRMEKVVYNNTDATNESVEMLKKKRYNLSLTRLLIQLGN